MDVRENFEDIEESMRVGFQAQMRHFFHVVKVTVSEDSTDGHTVSLQPVIQRTAVDQNNNVSQITMPPLPDVPIKFMGGGGTTSTHKVAKGDEGTALIFTHAIDTWHQQGGIQVQIDDRMHSLSDAHYLPGGRSDPRKLPKVSTDSHQIRSDDKKMVIDHHPTDGTHIKAADASTQAASESFDPFTQATKFFESLTHPANGIAHNATDGGTTHSVTNTHTAGPMMSAANGDHTVNAHPSNGVGIVSSIAHTIMAPNASLDHSGNLSAEQNITSTGGNISAPAGAMSALSGAFSSLSAGSGGMSSSGSASFGSVSAGTVEGDTVQTVHAYTVAGLNTEMPPTMALQGTRAFVTDAASPTFLATLAGGGMKVCPAFCDGSNWVAG